MNSYSPRGIPYDSPDASVNLANQEGLIPV
jgi:hypothetical protein